MRLRSSRARFYQACGFIVYLILLLELAPALAAAATKPSSTPGNESCTSCHEEVDHGGLDGTVMTECVNCHGSVEFEKMRLASEKIAHSSTSNKTMHNSTMGMQGEMYYEKSHLGDAPNEMILIPAGEFTMGTNSRLPDEGPEHKVTLPAFYIDKYEVTNLQYKKFNDATNRKSPSHFKNRTYPDGKADHPVTFVSWHDAKAYCAWAGKRLPTDEEWEKAARGTDGRNFPWGDVFGDDKANTPVRWEALEQAGDTTPVGAFPAGVSPYGLYDMSGNVWEWTASWYKAYPGNTHPTENYGEKYKVLKGGSWWDCSFYKCGISAPSFNRAFFLPGTRNKSFGFRCAKEADK
jgi:formylglycine-generating enzyme required for sulfatase activity